MEKRGVCGVRVFGGSPAQNGINTAALIDSPSDTLFSEESSKASSDLRSECRRVGSAENENWGVRKSTQVAKNVEGWVSIYSSPLTPCVSANRGGLGTECVYEPKEKPGLKGGAVENLNRRVG